VDASALTPRARYQLLTSLVVPRPIGWLSTRSAVGTPNLAPFSFFNLVSTTPPFVVVSIGARRSGEPKDSLANILATGGFCVNVVSQDLLAAMNASSGSYGPDVDEFEVAGLTPAPAATIPAAYVAEAPAVLECQLLRSVELPGSANTLLVGQVLLIRVAEDMPSVDGTQAVDPVALRPVGRLGGAAYMLPGEVVELARPVVPDGG
jgi:flavin reductase (DIM6/NTAB) family NADH-FMN oxidoreductase RutF